MPCVDWGGHAQADYDAQKRAEKDALLCSACRVLARMGYDFDENPALSVWWAAHKQRDAAK